MSALALANTAFRLAPQFFEHVSADLKRPVIAASHCPQFQNWTAKGFHAAWIGHSTVVIQIEGFTIITDPVFSNRVGVNFGPLTLGIKRLVAPAVPVRAIPRPDLILLSHAHMDHFDLPSLRALENRQTSVVTAVNTTDLLRPSRYEAVQELRWNETTQVGPAKIQAFEVKHWGARMQSDTQRGYNGYVVEIGKRRFVFGGDTAMTGTFQPLRALGPIDLAIMPIGAYDPWIAVHCNPEQAMRMANDSGAEFCLPVHHRTFELSKEPIAEPIERFVSAAGAHSDRVILQEIGQEFSLSL